MNLVMTGAWVIQAAVGAALLVGWIRHARGDGRGLVSTHVVSMLLALAAWVAFTLTAGIVWAWVAVGVLTFGIGFGDAMMVRRYRRMVGESRPGMRDYGAAIGAVFTGRLPARVVFHAAFSAVVYFGSLAVAIVATASR